MLCLFSVVCALLLINELDKNKKYSYIRKCKKNKTINAFDFECPSLKLSNAFDERLNHIADNTSKQGITHAGTCTTAFTTKEFDAVRVRQDVLMTFLILCYK